jgi:arylsulfatase A-like enzyme
LDIPGKTLIEILKETGYRTLGISTIPQLSITKRFNRGFDHYIEAWKLDNTRWDVPRWKAKIRSFLRLDEPVTRYAFEQIQKWLKHHDPSAPFFIFANMNTAHTPYQPPPRFLKQATPSMRHVRLTPKLKGLATRDGYQFMARHIEVTEEEFGYLGSLYDGEIVYLDYVLGQVFTLLQTRGLLENTLIVLLADHGENLGDHGLMYHQFCLYDSLIRIPMIWHFPKTVPCGKKISHPVSIIDVMPSILHLAGIPNDVYPFTQGYCLLCVPHPRTHDGQGFIIAEYYAPPGVFRYFRRMVPGFDYSAFDKGFKCIRTLRHKYIISSKGQEELYDLLHDREEQNNIIKEAPGIAGELRRTLFKTVKDFGEEQEAKLSVENDDVTIRKLKALGYI